MVHEAINMAVTDSGLKQKYVAECIGISETAFSAMLAGKRKVDVDEFFGLCKILKKTPDELYSYNTRKAADDHARA